jgi:hypothetical protein
MQITNPGDWVTVSGVFCNLHICTVMLVRFSVQYCSQIKKIPGIVNFLHTDAFC